MPATYPVEVPDANYFARQVLCREGCPVRTDSGGYGMTSPKTCIP